MKRHIWKRKKLNKKSSDYNTRFDDNYFLYKYNIGIDYRPIRNIDEERYTKKEKGWIIKVVIITQDLTTLTDYTSTI